MPYDPAMDKYAKEALGSTKELHKRVRDLEQEDKETDRCNPNFKELKKLASDANKAIQAMQRLARDEALRADVRHSILREAVRDELIDREANAARVAERVRLVGDTEKSASVWERGNQLAAVVEASIASLCPHQTRHGAGVALLATVAQHA